ncbi:MAG: MlaD family protein [Phycisphaerae bacterium]
MSAQVSYFRLGLFVLLGIGLLVGGVIVLGAGAMFSKTIPAETYFNESVQGLEVGSPVKYRGVQIGKVGWIGMVSEKYELKDVRQMVQYGKYVMVVLELEQARLPKWGGSPQPLELLKQRVAAGMRVRLQSSLTGPTFIEVDYVPPDVYRPLEIAWTPALPYVPSAPGTMTQMVSAVERLAAQIEKAEIAKVVENINTLTEDVDKAVNGLQAGKISEQILALTNDLHSAVERLDKILGNPAIDKGIADLGTAAAGVRDIVASSQDDVKATLKDLPRITARLASTAEEIDTIIKSPEIKRAIAGLADTADQAGPAMISVRKSATRLENLLRTQQRDIEALVAGLRKTIENVSALSEDASKNPSRLLFGAPPPRSNVGDRK